MLAELLTLVKTQITGRGIATLSDAILNSEIESAIEVVNDIRNFTPTADILYEEKYKNKIVKMVIHAISKYGAEGEQSHTEGEIGRSYGNSGEYPLEILSQITPKVKVGGN